MGVGVLLDDLDGADHLHRHRAHPHDDLGLDRVRARRLEHAATLDGRHDALEVRDRREALVDRLLRREGVLQLGGHPVCSCVGGSPIYARRVLIEAGTHGSDPTTRRSRCTRARGGAAAKAGHDLVIHVTSWQATLEVGAEPAQTSVELTADATSLRVRKGTGGMQALGDGRQGEHPPDDRRRGAQAPRRSCSARPGRRARPTAAGSRVEGDLTLAGSDRSRSPSTSRRRRRHAQRHRRRHADPLGHEALLRAVRCAEGPRRRRGRARRPPLVLSRDRRSGRRDRPRRRGGRAPVPCA